MTLFQRIMRVLRQGLEWAPDRFFAHRHPGAAARIIIFALAPLIVRLTPNDKWSLGAHVPYWLCALEVAPVTPLPAPKRILLYCAYRSQFTHDFMVAILLAWRGHTVTIGYLPKLQSPIKPPLVDHVSAKLYLSAILGRVETWSNGRIRCVDLTDAVAPDSNIDPAILKSQVLSDTIMCVRRETIDRTDPETAAAWSYYEAQARRSHAVALSYLSCHQDEIDLLLMANGTTFESAQFCQVAKALGIPLNTFEKFDFRQIRTMNHGDHFLAFDDLDAVWRQREDLGYHTEPYYGFACDRAMELLGERRGASTANWGVALQKSPDQSLEDTLRVGGVEDGRRYVLVCTNIPYDAGYAILLGLFPSMRAWLLATVKSLLEDDTIHVVVRAHPGEAAHYGGKERSEEVLADYVGHERLTMITGEQTANTYNLIEKCHFGVVFSSTTGIEMAMLGKTVMVGATVYYGRRGFTMDSADHADYFAQLSRLATLETAPVSTKEQSRQAALFHFIFHFVMLWPYPYDKPSSVRATPPQMLVRSNQMARYIPFLDALSCDRDEWTAAEFLMPYGGNHVPLPEDAAKSQAAHA